MAPGALFERVENGDTRVGKARQQPGLASEAGAPLFIFDEFFRQHFERHRPVHASIPRPIHFAHASSAERCEDLVGAEAAAGRQRHGLPLRCRHQAPQLVEEIEDEHDLVRCGVRPIAPREDRQPLAIRMHRIGDDSQSKELVLGR